MKPQAIARISVKPGADLEIEVKGSLNSQINRDFTQAWEGNLAAARQVTINFQHCRMIDSAGLGLLLLLRDRAQGQGKKVLLKGVEPATRRILEITNFHQLFEFI